MTTLVPSYVAPEVRWQETTADPVDDAAAIARWGEGEPKGVDLLAVQHHGQAAHLCKQELALMNPDRRMKIRLRAFGLRLIGEQKVAVNIPRLGLENTPFWIEGLNFDGSNVTLDLIEAKPSAYDWAAGEEGAPPAEPETITRAEPVLGTPITSVTVITTDGAPYIRVQGIVETTTGHAVIAQYRSSAGGGWTDMAREAPSAGSYAFRTMPLADLSAYDVRTFIGRYENSSGGQELRITSTPEVVTNITVVANNDPPADPVVVSASGAAGGTLSVTFMADLGANYRRTGLYRAPAGGSFEDASFVKWAYDTSSDVTMTAPIPAAGARFFLQSENPSQRKSGPVVVGNLSTSIAGQHMVNTTQTPGQIYPAGQPVDKANVIRFEQEMKDGVAALVQSVAITLANIAGTGNAIRAELGGPAATAGISTIPIGGEFRFRATASNAAENPTITAGSVTLGLRPADGSARPAGGLQAGQCYQLVRYGSTTARMVTSEVDRAALAAAVANEGAARASGDAAEAAARQLVAALATSTRENSSLIVQVAPVFFGNRLLQPEVLSLDLRVLESGPINLLERGLAA